MNLEAIAQYPDGGKTVVVLKGIGVSEGPEATAAQVVYRLQVFNTLVSLLEEANRQLRSESAAELRGRLGYAIDEARAQ